jgi:hypothetical protein
MEKKTEMAKSKMFRVQNENHPEDEKLEFKRLFKVNFYND